MDKSKLELQMNELLKYINFRQCHSYREDDNFLTHFEFNKNNKSSLEIEVSKKKRTLIYENIKKIVNCEGSNVVNVITQKNKHVIIMKFVDENGNTIKMKTEKKVYYFVFYQEIELNGSTIKQHFTCIDVNRLDNKESSK